ncbi:10948_t:CDS:2 [Ambispora gerdemannii]|uniref:10948_t:CDS:1 n=1 Tax=Ambispora gerdemannii TaxID=144530 RepID=A0A9N9ATK8_9GLOM|nr:10948_t:CDS:2 [Ambispora gerdemannii]
MLRRGLMISKDIFRKRILSKNVEVMNIQRYLATAKTSPRKTPTSPPPSSLTGGYTPPPSIIVPEKQFPNPSLKGTDLMQLIHSEQISRFPIEHAKLLKKTGKDRIIPGDVLLVESYTNRTNLSSVSTFAGICIAIRRRGIETSFTLRNVILKVGVEQRFAAFSPMIKSIKILARGEGYRRAKLYYLRDQPGKAFKIASMIKKLKAAQQKTNN